MQLYALILRNVSVLLFKFCFLNHFSSLQSLTVLSWSPFWSPERTAASPSIWANRIQFLICTENFNSSIFTYSSFIYERISMILSIPVQEVTVEMDKAFMLLSIFCAFEFVIAKQLFLSWWAIFMKQLFISITIIISFESPVYGILLLRSNLWNVIFILKTYLKLEVRILSLVSILSFPFKPMNRDIKRQRIVYQWKLFVN